MLALRNQRAAGAGWEADILLPGAEPAGSAVTVRLPARPGSDASEVTVTAIDAPMFGPDGLALAGTSDPRQEDEDGAHQPAFERIGEGNGR